MLFKNIAAVAALLAVSDAFLIPAKISKTDIDTVNTLPFEITAEGVSKVVDLKCSGCPVPAVNVDGSLVSLQHVDSNLELNYSIEHSENAPDSLLLNGVSIYPPHLASIQPFTASQKFSKDSPFQTKENVPLGYEMTLHPIKKDAANLELIAINIHIFEVADKFIDGIESVELQLLKTPSGNLMIASLEMKPATSASPVGVVGDDKDCTSVICKWRAIVAAKLAHLKPLKGCMKGMGMKGKGSKAAGVIAGQTSHGKPQPHAGRPHHGQHHGGHRHNRHRSFSRFMHMLRSITIHVLIPVFIGVAAGLAASLVGMVMGQLVVLAWRSIRGGSPAYSRIALDESYDDEKAPIITESPPVYEEVVVIEVEEDKKETEV